MARKQPDILTLFQKVRDHPDFAGGTIWTREDVATLVASNGHWDFNPPTPEQIAAVTDDQMAIAQMAAEAICFRDYGWPEAIRDLDDAGVFPTDEEDDNETKTG